MNNETAKQPEFWIPNGTVESCIRDLRDHYNTDWDTTVPGKEFDAELGRILEKHLNAILASRTATQSTGADEVRALRSRIKVLEKALADSTKPCAYEESK